MLTSQHGCQFAVFAFLLSCSFCTPEDETNYPIWQTNDYDIAINEFSPSTDNFVSLPNRGGGSHISDNPTYQDLLSSSKLRVPESNYEGASSLHPTDPKSPFEVFIGEYFRPHLAKSSLSAKNQNSRDDLDLLTPSLKQQNGLRDTRKDWSNIPSLSSSKRREGDKDFSDESGSQDKLLQEAPDGILSTLISENLPLTSKRIQVKKKWPNGHAAIKRWWGKYYRPRPQMDRPQSKHYGCLKRCISAGKLHPIQCHTLC